ncbi:MAG: sulfotransferase family 2 domain-containing protein [Granulosicoccus sp.]
MLPDRHRKRTILLHYHLFKNGGTSIEKLLRDSFGKAWASWDKEQPGAKISGAEMQAWIEQNKKICAISSHQIVPPVPQGDFHVIPIVFLRDPLLRVRSSYSFEWQKQLGLDEPKGSLQAYIEEKFKQKNSSVIANFQVSRLSNDHYDEVRQKLDRHDTTHRLSSAMRFIDQLPFIGLVERFEDSMGLIQLATRQHFPKLKIREYRENVTQAANQPPEQRIDQLRRDIGNELFDELCLRNRLDLQLYSYALGRFNTMCETRLSPDSARQSDSDQSLIDA